MKSRDFYPAKCPICYWRDTCDHKHQPSSTKGCFTHLKNCGILAGSNPTRATNGYCDCGFKTFNFRHYFENPTDSKPTIGQAILKRFLGKEE